MNFHTDKWIMDKLKEHYEESKQYFSEEQIVGIFLQGSQNYGLDTELSDIDTKLVVVPNLWDIALNKKAVSTTHVRENEEHIDFKDVRLMLQTFKKQNLNFIEILFTPYKIINPLYEEAWNKLIKENEKIARYNPVAAVKSMRGIAMEKYHAMEHRYPSKIEILDKYKYDPKQLHHLLRIEEYLERYIENSEPYANLLFSKKAEFLKNIKIFAPISLEDARRIGKEALEHIEKMYQNISEQWENKNNEDIEKLLEQVQYEIIKIAVLIKKEK